jgi:hypothetical protein
MPSQESAHLQLLHEVCARRQLDPRKKRLPRWAQLQVTRGTHVRRHGPVVHCLCISCHARTVSFLPQYQHLRLRVLPSKVTKVWTDRSRELPSVQQ